VAHPAASANRWNSRGRSAPSNPVRRLPGRAPGWRGRGRGVLGAGSATDGTRRRNWANSSDSASGTRAVPVPATTPRSPQPHPQAAADRQTPPPDPAPCARAKPRPRPVGAAIRASRADFAGLRTASPTRSSTTRVAATATPATPSSGVTASSGTHGRHRVPDHGQAPVPLAPVGPRAAHQPQDQRHRFAGPGHQADGHRGRPKPRNGPATARMPAQTMSAARLTSPNATTARHGDQGRAADREIAGVSVTKRILTATRTASE